MNLKILNVKRTANWSTFICGTCTLYMYTAGPYTTLLVLSPYILASALLKIATNGYCENSNDVTTALAQHWHYTINNDIMCLLVTSISPM